MNTALTELGREGRVCKCRSSAFLGFSAMRGAVGDPGSLDQLPRERGSRPCTGFQVEGYPLQSPLQHLHEVDCRPQGVGLFGLL